MQALNFILNELETVLFILKSLRDDICHKNKMSASILYFLMLLHFFVSDYNRMADCSTDVTRILFIVLNFAGSGRSSAIATM